MKFLINFFCAFLWLCHGSAQPASLQTQVAIVGGGTAGTAAAIQAARSGARTLLMSETPWLGGMLTAAGVGCTDGNHQLPSGLWQELREACYRHYRTRNLATGWVSNFNIEPHVGDSVLKAMAKALPNLTIWYGCQIQEVRKAKDGSIASITVSDAAHKMHNVQARVYVDATDLGDLLARAGAPFHKGIEADSVSDEKLGVRISSGVLQDLTYAAVLKDYGPGAQKTIAKPANYDPKEFDCSCTSYCHDSSRLYSRVDAQKMLDYGKMPGKKYMINWPSNGNDIYTDIIDRSYPERLKALDSAKQKTLRFIYFIQHQLGFSHLGLADDEYPTPDGLPFIAYHREGRRLQGLVRLNIPTIQYPYSNLLYRTGISVGDYPIDHHHREYRGNMPALHFPPVPSYSIPAGALLNKTVPNLVVCDKPISVSNGANGTTRLQPVTLLTGQAAGMVAAQAITENKFPSKISVRGWQAALLQVGAMILPLVDATPTHPQFIDIQKIAATGILRFTGKPVAWANQTWFYPDSLARPTEWVPALAAFFGTEFEVATILPDQCSGEMAYTWVKKLANQLAIRPENLSAEAATVAQMQQPITRAQLCVLLQSAMRPFEQDIDFGGQLLAKKQPKARR